MSDRYTVLYCPMNSSELYLDNINRSSLEFALTHQHWGTNVTYVDKWDGRLIDLPRPCLFIFEGGLVMPKSVLP